MRKSPGESTDGDGPTGTNGRAPEAPGSGFERSIDLRSAVAINMTQMCGIGPFVTIPLIMATGVIGLVQYLGYLIPGMSWVEIHVISLLVVAIVLFALYRHVSEAGAISTVLWVVALLSLLIVASPSWFWPRAWLPSSPGRKPRASGHSAPSRFARTSSKPPSLMPIALKPTSPSDR